MLTMYSIRLRGIYATALAAMVLDHKWKIVQPMGEFQSHTDPEDFFAVFDVDLRDRDDKQGVLAIGSTASLHALGEMLLDELPDVIAYSAQAELGAIYLGVVHKRRFWGFDIDLGSRIGFLPRTEVQSVLRTGEAIRVQVRDLTHAGHQLIVTTQLSLAGRFVVLTQDSGVGISKEINDSRERARLLSLGKRLARSGLGVIWRTGASGRDMSDLQRDLQELQQGFALLQEHPDEGIPGKLRSGETTLVFEFPGASKQTLDRWRARLVATELGHHKCQAKPMGKREGAFPSIGDSMTIEHIRARRSEESIVVHGRVESVDPQHVTVRRGILGRREYDGLGIRKETGDYAISEFCDGDWKYETRYYTHDGRLRGTYVNVNTPIEIYADSVRYVDLELDVVQKLGEPAFIIDDSDFEHCADLLSERLRRRARSVATDCLQELSGRD